MGNDQWPWVLNRLLANVDDNLSAITTLLVLAIASVGGIALIILYLSGQAGRTQRGQQTDSAILVSPRLMPSARMAVSSKRLSCGRVSGFLR